MLDNIKNKLKGLSIQTKASIAYMFGSILTKGINILTLPIYTRLLTTSDMGVVNNFTSWYAIFYAIITLSLTTASLSVAMIDYKKESEKYQSVCLMLSTLSSIAFAFIYLLFYSYINVFTTLNVPLMVTQILLFIFNPALDSWYIKKRFEYKYKSVLLVSVSITLLSILISIIAVYKARVNNIVSLGIVRIIAQNGIIILFGIYFWFKIMLKGRTIWNKNMVIYALKLSLPLIIHTLAKNILDTSDRLMITKLCGTSDAGIYGTVYNISLIAMIIWSAINSAIVPEIFQNLRDNNIDYINKLAKKVLLIMGGATILSTLIAPEILQILTTKEYYSAVYMMPAILVGVYFTALYNLYGNILMYYKKSINVMFATCFAAILNIVLNYICILLYGYMAAAYTTFISFVFLAILQGVMQFQVTKREIISTKSAIVISIIVCILCLAINWLYSMVIIRYIVFIAILSACFINKDKIKSVLKI